MKIIYTFLLIIFLFTTHSYSQDVLKQRRDSLQNQLQIIDSQLEELDAQREKLKSQLLELTDSIAKVDSETLVKAGKLEEQRVVLKKQIQELTDSIAKAESEALLKEVSSTTDPGVDESLGDLPKISNIEDQTHGLQMIGSPSGKKGPFTLNGTVLDTNGEPLVGATIVVNNGKKGTIADENGKYSIDLDKGYYTLEISFIGYKSTSIEILVRGNGALHFELAEDLVQMAEVIIYSTELDVNVKGVTLGKTNISIETIETLPPFAGELDVLKSITLLPGISSVGESSSGFNVRGGGADQNLILLDNVTLYNPSHLFGFFSAFNSDVLSDVTVYKGGIPAIYGGRGSSIIDLKYKKGNPEIWNGKASIGTISAKFQLNGPIVKNKLSILFGGRASYSNWILNSVKDPEIANSAASFYDISTVVNYNHNENNKLSYSFYRSFDDFKFVNDTTYSWSNTGHSLKWDHAFNKTFALNLSVVRSEYNFNIINKSGIEDFELSSSIIDQSLNLDFLKGLGNLGNVSFGAQAKYITIDPGSLIPVGSSSGIVPKDLQAEQALETGLYFQHELSFLNEKFGFSYGLRYSRFMYLGDKTVFQYEQYLPRAEENIIDQTTYADNEVIKTYDGFEPRISLRYSINDATSIKAGYNKINQYIHLISNTTTIAPTDIWKLSDPYLLPQSVTQYSLGFFKNFNNNTIETSIEGYYKDQLNIIEYKDGASLILNDHLETELLNGLGKSYGVEVYFRRTVGFLRGWVGYTYSRSLRQVVGSYPEELINGGDWFPSNFDKPHDLTAVLEIEPNPNVIFSSILTYSTGRSVSYPSAKFNYFGTKMAYFDKRNDQRAPNYMRIDVSFIFDINSRKKVFDGKLTLSVFNLLGRKNAFSVFFDDVENAPPQAYKLSILGIPFPSASYSFTF